MEPIRVLHIVTLMNRAGLETMIMNYYRNIDRKKVQFDFLQHREGTHDYDEEIKALGGKIYTVPPLNPLNSNGYLTELNRFFKEHKEYNIVHSHLDCLSTYPLFYAKKYGVKKRIAHAHCNNIEFDVRYPIKIASRSLISRYATDLFACSNEAGKWMFHSKNFTVINNAIDTEKFAYNINIRKTMRDYYSIQDRFVVGHVGRFMKPKNHTFLIDIFKKIKKRISNSVLMVVGSGDLENYINKKVLEEGLKESVIFVGAQSNVNDYLQAMDVFVFPSLYEGLGISLIEAQASGLKCFTSNKRVPKSVNITGDVSYLDLEKGSDYWAEKICEFTGKYNRKDKWRIIEKTQYDIKEVSERLEYYYLCCENGRQECF